MIDSYSCVHHNIFIRATWHIFTHATSYIHMWQQKPVCINQEPDTPTYVWHDSHSYVQHYIFIRTTWRIFIQATSYIFIREKRNLCVSTKSPTPLHMCDMTHIHMCNMAYSYALHHPESGFMSDTWLRIHVQHMERWGAGVEYHFQECTEPYAPS